jgi:citronellol/citronellal dehydrogenase
LNLSPPLSSERKWYGTHLAYTLSKYGMTMCTLGMAEEFAKYGIAVNSLWPHRLIATAATRMLLGEQAFSRMRKPSIMAEAALGILTTPSRDLTGQCLIDEEFLRVRGETQFEKYSVSKGAQNLELDLFMDA